MEQHCEVERNWRQLCEQLIRSKQMCDYIRGQLSITGAFAATGLGLGRRGHICFDLQRYAYPWDFTLTVLDHLFDDPLLSKNCRNLAGCDVFSCCRQCKIEILGTASLANGLAGGKRFRKWESMTRECCVSTYRSAHSKHPKETTAPAATPAGAAGKRRGAGRGGRAYTMQPVSVHLTL